MLVFIQKGCVYGYFPYSCEESSYGVITTAADQARLDMVMLNWTEMGQQRRFFQSVRRGGFESPFYIDLLFDFPTRDSQKAKSSSINSKEDDLENIDH